MKNYKIWLIVVATAIALAWPEEVWIAVQIAAVAIIVNVMMLTYVFIGVPLLGLASILRIFRR